MGGWNSGRRGGTATVEGCASIVLNLDTIMRTTAGRSPVALKMEARINDLPQTILLRLDLDHGAGTGSLTLQYDVQHATAATGPQRHSVQMVSTPCRFGGWRWWLLCPATGRRAVKLYLPNGGRRFLSRAGYRLAYQSQRETVTGRAWRAIRKVDARLGVPGGVDRDAIPKPKWMRWPTFERLCDRRGAAQDAIDDDLIRVVDRMAHQLRCGGSREGVW